MKLSYIPAGVDFLKTLAQHLRDNSTITQTPLSHYQILLPTRRAVRTLQEYLTPPDGTAAFLPRMDAIGDLDDDILTLHLPDLEIPPVISNTARLGQLMQMIQARQEMPLPRALALAEALAKLMDEATLREISLSQLSDLVTGDIAEHWHISLNWLQIIIQEWPQQLAARGEVDSAQARQYLLNHYAQMWRTNPPTHPIIAAGSTGSLPATRRLLRAIAELPRGHVILPALDTNLPDDIWAELPESHPEKNLKNLLDDFGLTRGD
ncbi:MAG TPA: double-strand break repair protein AddB, partial [Alphaproteobacteria bacterium]|nr:double-strand break repair protein AddB [Alphaproteobacteria bacterium]